jgi:hypothetical protein
MSVPPSRGFPPSALWHACQGQGFSHEAVSHVFKQSRACGVCQDGIPPATFYSTGHSGLLPLAKQPAKPPNLARQAALKRAAKKQVRVCPMATGTLIYQTSTHFALMTMHVT